MNNMQNFRMSLVALMAFAAWPAQAANECGAVAGPAPDVLTCPAGNQTTGISYSTEGDLTLNMTGNKNVGVPGIAIVGNGGDSVTVNATGNVTGASGNVRTLDVVTSTGDITVIGATAAGAATTFTAVSAGASNTHAIRLESTGGGDITVNANGSAANTSSAGNAGIYAVTAGGDIRITGNGAGNGHAIYAHTTGAGDILITGIGALSTNNGGSGVAGIEANSGSGNITILGEGRAPSPGGGLSHLHGGVGIIAHTAGTVLIESVGANQNGISGHNGAIQASGSQITVNIRKPDARAAVRLDQLNGLIGSVDFSAATSPDTVTTITIGERNRWQLGQRQNGLDDAYSVLSAGWDTVNIETGGWLMGQYFSGTGSYPNEEDHLLGQIDFGSSDDVLNMNGTLLVGAADKAATAAGDQGARRRFNNSAEIRLLNLETYNSAGAIYLGALVDTVAAETPAVLGTDRWYDDILSMPGATFNGLEGSRVFADVELNRGAQVGCDASLRAENGDLPAADCINLKGGTTTGQTSLVLVDIFPFDRGVYNPDGIVLVDVQGGDSAAGHFVLDPASSNYNPSLGGFMDKGVFIYALEYDEHNQQHKLVGLPGAPGLQQAALSSLAQTLWRTTTATSTERQADLRDTLRKGGKSAGFWLRTAGDDGERTLSQHSVTSAGNAYGFDNSHDLTTSTIALGVDTIIDGGDETTWILGASLGYGRADARFETWTNKAWLNGMAVGAYASLLSGPLFVDATVNTNWLEMHQEIPALELPFDSLVTVPSVRSLGAQLDAGWRFAFGNLGLEPLLHLGYVTTRFDEAAIPSGDPLRPGIAVEWDSNKSLRGGVGLRGTWQHTLGAVRMLWSLTARVANEFEAQNMARLESTGAPSAPVADTFDGMFTDVTGGLSLAGLDGRLSGFLNLNTKRGDGYDSLGASAGLRYQW